MKSREREILVECLARIEGEAGLHVTVRNGKVESSKVRVFEPPRLFEAFLRGRSYQEVPDITARICGICPVAYQMTAVRAIERAFGVDVSEGIRALRHLLYYGEWIESHALHVFLLHAPDFLGYQDAIAMAKDHPAPVKMGLELKKIGNELVTRIGGREVHPVNVCVGGFHRLPDRDDVRAMEEKLTRALDLALEAVRWVSTLPMPEYQHHHECVCLQPASGYPVYEGAVVSSSGLRLPDADYEAAFTEAQVAHSHALHSSQRNFGTYLVGPLARYNLNFMRLSPLARQAAEEAGLPRPCSNPFRSIVVRCVEIAHACESAIGLLRSYQAPDRGRATVSPRAGAGQACTEAPRGLLYHRYVFDRQGLVQEAKIVPPTSQNLTAMEEDLSRLTAQACQDDDVRLTWLCEQAIRSYDPCISCATHLLDILT